jgi:hypothetical protein
MQYKWVALSNTTIGILMASLDTNIVLIALPRSGRTSPTPPSSALSVWSDGHSELRRDRRGNMAARKKLYPELGKNLLNGPRGKPRPDATAMMRAKVPKPEEIPLLSMPLVRASMKIGSALKGAAAKWAFGGDAAEVAKGVVVSADHLEIVTTKPGTDEICGLMGSYVTLAPAQAEKRLPRDADVDVKMLPVYIRSHYAELTVDKVKVEVYGDLQYKVGEWDWGDPIDCEPEFVNIVGVNVPVLPLKLKSELDLGLGWFDRLELISDAFTRSQHRLTR